MKLIHRSHILSYGRLRSHNLVCSTGLILALLFGSVFLSGCHQFLDPNIGPYSATTPPEPPSEPSPTNDVPRELAPVSLPTYVIEPPDILLIDAVKIVPRSPHIIESFDILSIRVEGTLTDFPIQGTFSVDPEGKVELGPSYGKVKVEGLSVDEAKAEINKHLQQILSDPEVSVALFATAGVQNISGQHLVGPDGNVRLGSYGSVFVAGMTILQAKQAIEKKLGEKLEEPEVTVSIFAYNSKVFYIITEGAGLGDSVVRVPITGNENVLDAVSQIGGLSQLSSKRMWISRPAPNGVGCEQILPIEWTAITRGASTATNYQVLPGDRLFIAEDHWIASDNFVAKAIRPFERMFGWTLLGTQMVARLNQLPGGGTIR